MCIVATKTYGSKVVPIWIQEAILMHPTPSFDEPYDGPFAEVFLTVVLRSKPGAELNPKEGECDFAFIHHGTISEPQDLGSSFNGGAYGWVNNMTPGIQHGIINRGLEFPNGDHTAHVHIKPLDSRAIRYAISSPLKASTVSVRPSIDFPENGTDETPFVLVKARPLCKECAKQGCCIARIRFTTNHKVDKEGRFVKYPAHGPNVVCSELDDSVAKVADEETKQQLGTRLKQVLFDMDPAIYDVALVGANSDYRYEIIGGYQHELLPPFFVEVNRNGDAITPSMKKLVRYFTPDTSDGNFMITALAEKLKTDETEQELAIRREVERARNRVPFKEETLEDTQDLLNKIGDVFESPD